MKVFRYPNGKCYHLPVKKGDVLNNLISCGSPERVEKIATLLKKKKTVAKNRGMICINGEYKGLPITAFNTGMGPATTAIILPEILDSINNRERVNLIRVGTAGSLQPYIKPSDLVVASSAIRDEGTTMKWITAEFPAVSGIKMSLALLSAAIESGYKLNRNLWYGIMHIKDELYAVENPAQSPIEGKRTEIIKAYKKMGAVATEMEFSVYPLLASIFNQERRKNSRFDQLIETGCIDTILSPSHSSAKKKGTTCFLNLDQVPAVKIGLEALVLKNQWDGGENLGSIEKLLFSL